MKLRGLAVVLALASDPAGSAERRASSTSRAPAPCRTSRSRSAPPSPTTARWPRRASTSGPRARSSTASWTWPSAGSTSAARCPRRATGKVQALDYYVQGVDDQYETQRTSTYQMNVQPEGVCEFPPVEKDPRARRRSPSTPPAPSRARSSPTPSPPPASPSCRSSADDTARGSARRARLPSVTPRPRSPRRRRRSGRSAPSTERRAWFDVGGGVAPTEDGRSRCAWTSPTAATRRAVRVQGELPGRYDEAPLPAGVGPGATRRVGSASRWRSRARACTLALRLDYMPAAAAGRRPWPRASGPTCCWPSARPPPPPCASPCPRSGCATAPGAGRAGERGRRAPIACACACWRRAG